MRKLERQLAYAIVVNGDLSVDEYRIEKDEDLDLLSKKDGLIKIAFSEGKVDFLQIHRRKSLQPIKK